ncbi:MAG TPA: maleylpyruvate isomerase family mycothiol-dependent enzyme [Acidimicrobiia bacterium]|jgi:uncharacterized protein (TIGR03083 family)
MDYAAECDQLAAIADSFATALDGADLSRPVPTCPDWTLLDLAVHTGRVHRWAMLLVRELAQERMPAPRDGEPGAADDVAGWFRKGGDALVATLRAADPEAPMWSWGVDQSVRFWSRRQVHETAIHQADALIALKRPVQIEVDVAADGIDELLDNLASTRAFSPKIAELHGDGESIHVHAVDTPDSNGIGEWVITLQPDGFGYSHGHAKGDVAVRGTISDLELMMYNRLPVTDDRFEVFGDRALLERWLAAAQL